MNTEQYSTIIQELQAYARQFQWENLNDITEATIQMIKDHYIVYINKEGKTCLTDTVECMQEFCSSENKKFLLIPQKLYEKLDIHLMFLANFGTVEEMIEIGNGLYKLYPDFNFFEI